MISRQSRFDPSSNCICHATRTILVVVLRHLVLHFGHWLRIAWILKLIICDWTASLRWHKRAILGRHAAFFLLCYGTIKSIKCCLALPAIASFWIFKRHFIYHTLILLLQSDAANTNILGIHYCLGEILIFLWLRVYTSAGHWVMLLWIRPNIHWSLPV